MTVFRMIFAGDIKKAESKSINGKSLLEVSLCKKHKGRNGADDTFSWLKVSIWEAPDFMIAKCVKGAFLAGSGEYQLRSYEKDGVKGHSAEVKCQSFDVEISDGQPRPSQADPMPQTATVRNEPKANVRMSVDKIVAAGISPDEPPF